MIDWCVLESLVNDLDQIWYDTESGRSRSLELHAINELGKCQLATAPALCFFAGRMVEVSVTSEWTRFQVRYCSSSASFRPSLDEQINHLQQLGRLDDLSTACIHEIRKLGNKVRHQAMFPSQTQAAFCLTMLKVALPWMAGGNRQQVQEVCDSHRVTVLDQEVQWLLNANTLASKSISFSELLQTAPNLLYTLNRAEPSFPTELTNWVTQQCINARQTNLAGKLISPFLQNGDADAPQLRPDRDCRFRVSHFNRLVALRLSRMGNPVAAIDFLTYLGKQAGYLAEDAAPISLRSSNSHAYAESLGILAGAHKTLWMEHGGATDLAHIAKLYRSALQAEPWNSYLAINAAACSAWAGDLATASALSAPLLQQLEPNLRALDESVQMNLWNILTHAEALLLAGQGACAIERYRHANNIFGVTRASDIQRAFVQVGIHAQHKVLDAATFATIAQVLGFRPVFNS
jgi:hypothetical protein